MRNKRNLLCLVLILLPIILTCCTKVKYGFGPINSEPKENNLYDEEEAIEKFKKDASLVKTDELDGAIIPIDITLPDYPKDLRGIEGVVEVYFIVDENGQVEDAKIIKSVHPDLDAHCLEVIKKWSFKPMTLGGKLVKVEMIQHFIFKKKNG